MSGSESTKLHVEFALNTLWQFAPFVPGDDIIQRHLPHRFAHFQRGGAKMQRRALRVMPKSLVAELDSKVLTRGFELPAGAFATSLINEICETR